MIFGAVSFCLSIFISFRTLFPVTRNLSLRKKKKPNPNILFFGDLAEMDLETFIEEFKIDDKEFLPSKVDINLMNEILINARIAKFKFKSFKFSLIFTMLGLIIVGVPLIYILN